MLGIQYKELLYYKANKDDNKKYKYGCKFKFKI